MRQQQFEILVGTRGRGLHSIGSDVAKQVMATRIGCGLLTLFIAHTSASLLVSEDYDPQVQRDLERFFARLVPDGSALFEHRDEGPDDMPAHVRAALTQTSITIPVQRRAPTLGRWQGIFVYEHRLVGQQRRVHGHVIGE
jgi:secondary thiamine-phosphate synthase enzyme